MASLTLLQLRTRIRTMGEYQDPFVTDVELTAYINSAIARMRLRLSRIDDSLFLSTDAVTVVAGTESYALPTGAAKVVAVAVLQGSKYYLLERIKWRDRYRYQTHTTTSAPTGGLYAIRGQKIYFWPSPTWGGTVKVDFIATATALSGDSDAFDPGIDGWDQWVLADVLTVCALKAEDSPAGWQQLKIQAEELMEFSAEVDIARPKTVADTGDRPDFSRSYYGDWRT